MSSTVVRARGKPARSRFSLRLGDSDVRGAVTGTCFFRALSDGMLSLLRTLFRVTTTPVSVCYSARFWASPKSSVRYDSQLRLYRTVPGPLQVTIKSNISVTTRRLRHGGRNTFYNIDDDSFLRIFSCYRLEDEDNWNLAHVCRRWRHNSSSFHLNVCLLLTNEARPSKMRKYASWTSTAWTFELCVPSGSTTGLTSTYLELMNKHFPRPEDLSLVHSYRDEGDEPCSS